MSDQGVIAKKPGGTFFQEPRTMPKKTEISPKITKASLLFTTQAEKPSETFYDEESEEGGSSGRAPRPAAKQASPDLATPGLFAGASATNPKISTQLNQQIRSHSASGLAARPFFGDQRPKKAIKPTENLANPNSRINRVLGPRLGKKGA